MESGGGMQKYSWAPGQNLAKLGGKWWRGMELLPPGAGCPGQWPDVRGTGCPGSRADVRAPGSGTNAMNSTGKRATPRQNSDEFVDGKCGKDGEKLDPLDAKQIRGSNPTKLHHTNKSQKNLGLFLVGIFGFRTKSTKSS